VNVNLAISEIEKSYGRKKVLAGCTHAFANGVTAVMGPNGCGKSTLLRICALLEPPDSGAVRYYHAREQSLPHDLDLMRRITLVLPGAGIFNATVWKNAAYGLMIRGVGRLQTGKRVKEILKTVGLYGRRRQNALTISSGEAQRLALARAMVLEPEVLFIDEPTASLDEENTAIVEELIFGMRRPGGPTVVIATHDRAQAERLADRIITIRNGRVPPRHGASPLGHTDAGTVDLSGGEGDDTLINP
jgi:tungstate transport system ATP-binding protein